MDAGELTGRPAAVAAGRPCGLAGLVCRPAESAPCYLRFTWKLLTALAPPGPVTTT